LAATAPVESERPNGPRSRKGAKTRARLVQAAKEIFEENGFLEARISDISERAGLSHGSFYHYFDSKEEIFREVAIEIEDELSEAVDTVILDPSSTASPRARLREAIRQFLHDYRREAPIVGVIEQVSRYDDELKNVRLVRQRHYNSEVSASIHQLQEHGLADPGLDPMITAWMLGAMTNRFAEMWLVQGLVECGFDDAVEHMSRLFANALGLADDTDAGATRRRRP
jgi:AcrR family transcriptional regulator